jgi:hypothetical protein
MPVQLTSSESPVVRQTLGGLHVPEAARSRIVLTEPSASSQNTAYTHLLSAVGSPLHISGSMDTGLSLQASKRRLPASQQTFATRRITVHLN